MKEAEETVYRRARKTIEKSVYLSVCLSVFLSVSPARFSNLAYTRGIFMNYWGALLTLFD